MATPSGRAPAARVRVRVTMSAPSLRYHVALVDYLPAGFETLNPELAITEAVPEDRKETSGSHWWLWRRAWFDHQNLRNERSEAFTTVLWRRLQLHLPYSRHHARALRCPTRKSRKDVPPGDLRPQHSDRVRIE